MQFKSSSIYFWPPTSNIIEQANETFLMILKHCEFAEFKWIFLIDCQPEHPISILNIHGTLDPLFPWYGGLFSSIPKTVDSWLRSNNCNLDKIEENSIALGIEERKWTDCIGNTTLVSTVKIEGGFHAWPPKRMLPEEFIWKFFKSSI